MKRCIMTVVVFIFLLFLLLVIISFIRHRTVDHLVGIVLNKYQYRSVENEFNFEPSFFSLPLGIMNFQIGKTTFQEKEVYDVRLSLMPQEFLKRISMENLGIDFSSLSDKNRLLPYSFLQKTSFDTKRGKSGRQISYDHENLVMERKGQKEDILDDTRDPLTLILWLMKQDYENKDLVKSTLNINRKIYLVIGQVKQKDVILKDNNPFLGVKLQVTLLEIDKGYRVKSKVPIEAYLIKLNDYYLPIVVEMRLGYFPLRITIK